MTLTNKRILILSPQSWGKMYLSKHHYAIELARRGNIVYFLNPPIVKAADFPGRFRIYNSGIENLLLIDHRLSFPYNLKFHAIGIFHWFMHFHIKKLLKAVKEPFDIIWSFDLGNLYPFRLFGTGPVRVFHPVDEPLNKTAIDSGAGAEIIFSVTREILEKYKLYDVPKHFINHGVSEIFIASVEENDESKTTINIGLSGNLTRKDIDRKTLLKIINEHPTINFHFWGSYHISQSNISGTNDKKTETFINDLSSCKNIKLHGPLPSTELATSFRKMDGFLICYDILLDQSKGTNYHKIMEYLSTGKVIISNNVSTYRNQDKLLQMVESRENNLELPHLFRTVVENLDEYNSAEAKKLRIEFSKINTYQNQISLIEKYLSIIKTD